MAEELSIIDHWLLPLAFLIAGIVAGFLFKGTILPVLRKCCLLAKQEGLEVVVAASSPYIPLWFALLGIYGSLLFAPTGLTITYFLKELLFVMAAGSLTLFIAKGAGDLFGLYATRKGGILPTTSMFRHLIYGLVGIFGALTILQSLGLSITPLLAALGVGGIAVALAVQNPLSNFFSGLHIIASTQIRPGDYIKLDSGEEGVVIDISWRTTSLRAPTNYIILVPNSKLASAVVTNYHLAVSEMVFSVDASVSYDSDLDEVQRIALDVARDVIKNVSGSIPESEPAFLYTGLGDFGINFVVAFRARDFGKQAELKHEFIKRLYGRFEAEGVKLPHPVMNIDH
jgi:small-conductance mechanosensitive channel